MRLVATTLSSLRHLAPGSFTSPAAALAAAAAARLPPSIAPAAPSSVTMATAASSSTLFARAAAVVAPTRRGAPAAVAGRRRPSAAFRTLPPAPTAAAGVSNNGPQGFRNSSRHSTRAVAADVTDASDAVPPAAAAAAAEAGLSLMSSELTWPHRTQTCGTLREADVGSAVTLCGWVDKQRDMGGIVFADLRDHTGLVQLVSDADTPAAATVEPGIHCSPRRSLADIARHFIA